MGYRTERRRQAEIATTHRILSNWQKWTDNTRHQNAAQAARSQRVPPAPGLQQIVMIRAIAKTEAPNGVKNNPAQKKIKIL